LSIRRFPTSKDSTETPEPRPASRNANATAVVAIAVLATIAAVRPLAAVVPTSQAATTPPRLVILLAVDQMRADYLDRFRDQFDGGFGMLLEQGAVFTNAHQAHAITATAPGHASMLSGVYPNRHGVIDNDWFDRDLQRPERAAVDPDYSVVGLDPQSDQGGASSSPRQFIGSSLAGWMKDEDTRSQAVSISRKDRAAVLMAPEAEQVYWFHWSGRFITSTYYRDDLPAWVERFNATDWMSEFAGASWTLLQAEALYAASRPDEYLGEARLRDFGSEFPHKLPSDRRELGNMITTTPFMDWATLEMGREAITALGLGTDEATDLLAIGLSTTDAVGHAFGPFSREMQDHLLRLDAELAGFFSFVDEAVGLDNVIIALTSDHGVAPLPEYSADRGEQASRLDVGILLNNLDRHISGIFGQGRWFSGYSYGWLQLNRSLCEQLGVNPDQVLTAAETYLKSLDAVAAVFSRADLESEHAAQTELEERVHRTYFPSRAGDLYIIHPPFSIWQTGAAANHQSPYFYDSHVPLILRGPGIEAGRFGRRVEIVDLAPTLARLLSISPPVPLDGRLLAEALAR
jgi:predicted AlkP superfamily pyrophosphatase or phosphodiesterase